MYNIPEGSNAIFAAKITEGQSGSVIMIDIGESRDTISWPYEKDPYIRLQNLKKPHKSQILSVKSIIESAKVSEFA